ncbi:MAG: ubiquinone biosynthesis protein UbiJ [Oceanospirillaceae bacterium]|jgi:ubiquinone biosynthesis protein UbiJ
MLHTGAILVLESTINKLIESDIGTAHALTQLSGKVFEFVVSDAPIHFYLLPFAQGIQLHQHYEHSADTSLEGSLSNFCTLATSEDKTSQFFGNGVKISGDTQLANKLQRILSNAEMDWEMLTAQLTGDLLAHQLVGFAKGINQQLNRTKVSFEQNFAEYLQEEIHTLPARPEVDGFIQDVDLLSAQTQRLEARINLLCDNIKA